MKIISANAILIAASLLFSVSIFAQTKWKQAEAYANRGAASLQRYNLTAYGGADIFLPDYEASAAKRRSNDLDGAIGDFIRALRLDPKAYHGLGVAKLERADLDGAIADFNRALQFDPKLASTYQTRGLAKELKGNLTGAIGDYSRSLQLNLTDAKALCSRGSAKINLGDPDGAIADFSRALQLNPKDELSYYGRGSANFLTRNWVAALRDYNRFCELSPRHNKEYAQFAIWMIRSRLGEREAANKELATRFTAAPGTWVSKIQKYLLGNLSETALVAAAASPDPKTDRKRHCEAWFYAGMRNLLDGNKPAAARLFNKCAATGRKTISEYAFAKAELKTLGQ